MKCTSSDFKTLAPDLMFKIGGVAVISPEIRNYVRDYAFSLDDERVTMEGRFSYETETDVALNIQYGEVSVFVEAKLYKSYERSGNGIDTPDEWVEHDHLFRIESVEVRDENGEFIQSDFRENSFDHPLSQQRLTA